MFLRPRDRVQIECLYSRLILAVHFKKISCPSTSTLKLKMLKINLKNILRNKIQNNEFKFYEMSLIASQSLIQESYDVKRDDML